MAATNTFGPHMTALIKTLGGRSDLTLKTLRRRANSEEFARWLWDGYMGPSRLPLQLRLIYAAHEAAGFPISDREMVKPQFLDRLISKLGPRWPLSMMDEFRQKEGPAQIETAATQANAESRNESNEQPEAEADAEAEDASSEEAGEAAAEAEESAMEDASDERELGQERPKDTDEVGEQSDNPSDDSQLHGGDGNSGEVDAQAETSSEEDRSGQQAGEESGESGGNDAAPDQAQEESGAPNAPQFKYDEELSEAENFSRFLNHLEEMIDGETREPETGERDGGPTAAKGSHGGICASLEDLKRRGRRCDPRAVTEIVRQIEKIFRQLNDNAGQEESPRLSGKRLVRELASRRMNLSRVRREELQPGVKLLMCDVSGSCSAVCHETLAACAAVAEADPQVVIVVHSNGYPNEVYGRAAAGMPKPEGYGKQVPWWAKLVQQCRIIGTINWGDWDAGDILEMLASLAPLVWLDSYCARDGLKPASRNLRASASSWKTQPIMWWQGVNDAERTAIALRQATKMI